MTSSGLVRSVLNEFGLKSVFENPLEFHPDYAPRAYPLLADASLQGGVFYTMDRQNVLPSTFHSFLQSRHEEVWQALSQRIDALKKLAGNNDRSMVTSDLARLLQLMSVFEPFESTNFSIPQLGTTPLSRALCSAYTSSYRTGCADEILCVHRRSHSTLFALDKW